MPSSKKARQVFLSLIEKGIVYELGSGWGTLAFQICKKNKVRAFEKALIPWFFSLLYKRLLTNLGFVAFLRIFGKILTHLRGVIYGMLILPPSSGSKFCSKSPKNRQKLNPLTVSKRKNLSIERKDFFSVGLFDADIIVCYLYPKAMERLAPKFEKELKKGAVVLCNSFQLPGRKPDAVIEVGDWMRSTIYCYRYE